MIIETTINIHGTILEKITHAALASGTARQQIITTLIKKQMDHVQSHIKHGKRIEYQEKDGSGKWHTFHIQLRPDDYEYFLDLRKLMKMSISRILAIAVGKYLNEILKKNFTDNYHYKNYIIIKELIDDVICWKFLWGFPRHPDRLFPHHDPPVNIYHP